MGKRELYRVYKLNIKAVLAVVLISVFGVTAFSDMQAGEAEMTVEAAEAERVEIPVVMYHSVLKDPKRHGEYVISPTEFENDLIYIKKMGYETVLIQDLINYTYGSDLPKKPILLTFDDGYYNNYVYAFEIAQRHNCKFVILPIASVTEAYSETGEENANYSHANWERLKEMSDSGLVEIQNHSYDMHKNKNSRIGVKQKKGESVEEYDQALREDLLKAQDLIEKNVGKRPTAFSYPFGSISSLTPELIRNMGFSATLTSDERVYSITRDPDSLFGLGRFVRPHGISQKEFFGKRMGLTDEK